MFLRHPGQGDTCNSILYGVHVEVLGTSWVVARVSDVGFAVYGGGDEVDNVEVLDVVDAVERGILDGRRGKQDVSF